MSTSGESTTVPTGLTPDEFASILLTESTAELASLQDEAQSAWDASTRRAWKQCTAEEEEAVPVFPFVVCDSTPDLSGNRRRKALLPRFLQSGGDVTFGDNSLYNAKDKTCFLVMSPGNVARSVGFENDETLRIQPLLPMMKIMEGTVKAAKQKCSSSNSPIRISAALSPDVSKDKETADIAVQDIFRAISHRGGDAAREQLMDAFPYTGPSMMNANSVANGEGTDEREETRGRRDLQEDPCNDIYQYVAISLDELGEVLYADVHPPSSVDDENTDAVSLSLGVVTAEKLLCFVAGLAAQPHISSIEIAPDVFLNV